MQFVLYSAEHPLSEAQFQTFWQLICQSFPEHERRRPEELHALQSNPAVRILAAQNVDGRLFGTLLLWVLPQFVFVEHFAVNPALRSQGIGRKLLEALSEHFEQPQILEIEPPTDPIRERRVAFFAGSGFHLNEGDFLLPCLHDGVRRSVPLKLMSRPLPIVSQQLDEVQALLYRVVFDGKPVRK